MIIRRTLGRFVLGLLCPVLAWGPLPATAQTVETLVAFTNSWQYDATGRQLGTEWTLPTYLPDLNWVSGPGLIGYEESSPSPYRSHAPVGIVLSLSPFVTNYYFRTTFTFQGGTDRMSLVASNLIDDGAVIYLNGVEVGRFRVPLNQNAATYASASPSDGAIDALPITDFTLLRQGENQLAVELHQAPGAALVDAMWGMKLVAFRPQPLVIQSNLPARTLAFLSESLAFRLEISGTPADYRWFKNGVFVATNATFRIAPVTLSSAGNYYVTISNSIHVVTSAVTELLVLPDANGPEAVEAIGQTNSATSPFRGAPTIDLGFNEPLMFTTGTTNTGNFFVYAGTNFASPVQITNITTTLTDKPRIHLWVTGTDWIPGGDYFVLIRGGVADARGTNAIDPYTLVGVSWPMVTNLVPMSAAWNFYANASLDSTFPSIYSEFFALDYGVNQHQGWAGPAAGILYATQGNPGGLNCGGGVLLSQISFQMVPTLFRHEFFVPSELLGSPILLTNRFIADDGLVVYLNGAELFRWNVPGTGPIDWNTEASTNVTAAACQTRAIATTGLLRPGRNVLAAAVVQSALAVGDTMFGLSVDALLYRTSPLPSSASLAPRLVSRFDAESGNLILSWSSNSYGAKLESTTNLNAPFWLQVNDQRLPYTNRVSQPGHTPTRFYRLNLR